MSAIFTTSMSAKATAKVRAHSIERVLIASCTRARVGVGGRAQRWEARNRSHSCVVVAVAGIDRGDRSRASASSSSRRPRARVARVEFYVLRRHIHARACDVARRTTTTARVPSSSVAKTSLANACVRACVRAWTDRMRRVFRDSRCNSALARRRASKLARRCAPPCDSPSTPPRYVRRSLALARARILVTPRGRRRVDRVSIASHRSMRSIDQMIDRCDRSIDRSKRQKMVSSSGCGAGVCVPMIGHVACVRPTDFLCLPDPRARRARRYASTRD